LGMLYLGFDKFILGNDIGGRPMLVVSILMIVMSVQMLTTGIIAELLSRTFFESAGKDAFNILTQDEGSDWMTK